MRLVVLCLVASAVLPSLSRAQVPVFAIYEERKLVEFQCEGIGSP